MELKDLSGHHMLSGVDRSSEKITRYGSMENCDVIRFRLDGIIYAAIENPDDGYRSSMDELVIEHGHMKNEFPAVAVVGIYKDKGEYNDQADILELVDSANGKIVLRIGTENTDDYYPYFVGEWTPENLSVNENKP